MGLTNPSREQPCTIIAVSVQSDSDVERRSYRLDRTIRPLDSITIGWIECDGFELKQGDRLWIHCKEFQQDMELQVEYKTESWLEWIANKVS